MWIVCITSVRHVLTVNGYGGRQTKENEKSWCFKGWETLVIKLKFFFIFYTTTTLHIVLSQIDSFSFFSMRVSKFRATK